VPRFDPTTPRPTTSIHSTVSVETVDAVLADVRDWVIAQGVDAQLADQSADRDAKRRLVLQAFVAVAPRHREVVQAAESEQERIVGAITQDILGYGPLTPLLDDGEVTEIIARGTRPVLVASNGLVRETDIRFRSDEHLELLCQRIAREAGRGFNFSEPICAAWLHDGSRAQLVHSSISMQGTCLTVRKHDRTHRQLADLVENDTLPSTTAAFLEACVVSRANIVISGATDTGKTTLLRSLAQCIPSAEYVVTIEDIDELQLDRSLPHVEALVTRPGDVSSIDHQALLQSALRMRPTRIIVGEVRGAEALDFLQAASTGHDGSLCSLHAGSPEEALFSRLPMMCALAAKLPPETIRAQIALATELVVQMEHLSDGRKRLAGIYEVLVDFTDAEHPQIATLYRHGEPLRAPTGRVAARLTKAGLA